MVLLATGRMLKNSADHKGGGASAEVAAVDMLWLGKREPVRQLKKAGVILVTIQQRLQIHINGRKDTKKQGVEEVGKTESPEDRPDRYREESPEDGKAIGRRGMVDSN
jgi:hypothetical protein